MFEDRRYIIIEYDQVTDEMLSNSISSNNKDNLRKSEKDGTNKIIITVSFNIPYCFNGMTSYTHDKIREIMADINGDWFPTELSASITRGDI